MTRKRTRKKQKSIPQSEMEVLSGTIRIHPRGFGFLIPLEIAKCPQEVFIPKHLTDNAVDGDLVEVALHPEAIWERGPEGRVITILKRGRTHLAGTISRPAGQLDSNAMFAYIPMLGATRPVIVKPVPEIELKVGDRVIVKVLEWGSEQDPTICEVFHRIGHISDPSFDIKAAIEEFDLRVDFPDAAQKQAEAIGDKVLQRDLKGRRDLTEEICFTIDPDTAKDYDDALTISKDKKGNYHLGVHIADVAHYVQPNSPIDIEAGLRCNSTYFPGTCVPMLPSTLSDNLCSLRQDVNRLTVSVLMSFNAEGELIKSEICRTYIKSKKRFTYSDAKKVLDGNLKSPYKSHLELMVELCLLLKQQRYKRGSIDFALPDLIVQVDETGHPTGIKIEQYDITHQLVEEFMLKANEMVARTLTERGKDQIYRIHEEPSKDQMDDFFALARSLGFKMPANPTQTDVQKMFEEAKQTTFITQLAVGFIRSMKLAIYSKDNVGHYGLGLEYYCHFTSPIRRYSDLVTQRLLFEEEDPTIPLSQIALHCSEQERLSFKAESSVKLLKKLRLLKNYLEADPTRVYPAIITRIKPFGIHFELKELFLEGFLHISELENDYFIYDQKSATLVGKTTKKRHIAGEELQVRLQSIDLIHLESRWELAEGKRKKRR